MGTSAQVCIFKVACDTDRITVDKQYEKSLPGGAKVSDAVLPESVCRDTNPAPHASPVLRLQGGDSGRQVPVPVQVVARSPGFRLGSNPGYGVALAVSRVSGRLQPLVNTPFNERFLLGDLVQSRSCRASGGSREQGHGPRCASFSMQRPGQRTGISRAIIAFLMAAGEGSVQALPCSEGRGAPLI